QSDPGLGLPHPDPAGGSGGSHADDDAGARTGETLRAPAANDEAVQSRGGLLDRDWQKPLTFLLTMLAGVAVLWVLWQVISPILHTLLLFGLAAVLAFALSGPVDRLTVRLHSRTAAIITTYLLAGLLIVGGLALL